MTGAGVGTADDGAGMMTGDDGGVLSGSRLAGDDGGVTLTSGLSSSECLWCMWFASVLFDLYILGQSGHFLGFFAIVNEDVRVVFFSSLNDVSIYLRKF